MVLKIEVIILLRNILASSLGILLLGVILNIISEEKSAFGMLLSLLGWIGSLSTGVILSTRRIVCPKCNTRTIPATKFDPENPCQYCS